MNKPKNCCYICDAPIFGNVSTTRRVLCPYCTNKLASEINKLEKSSKKSIKTKADCAMAQIEIEILEHRGNRGMGNE